MNQFHDRNPQKLEKGSLTLHFETDLAARSLDGGTADRNQDPKLYLPAFEFQKMGLTHRVHCMCSFLGLFHVLLKSTSRRKRREHMPRKATRSQTKCLAVLLSAEEISRCPLNNSSVIQEKSCFPTQQKTSRLRIFFCSERIIKHEIFIAGQKDQHFEGFPPRCRSPRCDTYYGVLGNRFISEFPDFSRQFIVIHDRTRHLPSIDAPSPWTNDDVPSQRVLSWY